MPDCDVRTLQDLIWYQYAKIIARRALGPDAKREHYGFVKQTLCDLQSGKKQWSDIAREDWQLVESEKRCVYCGSSDNLSRDHLVPKTLRINDEGDGSIDTYLWLRDFDFLVLMKKYREGRRRLITSYFIDYPHKRRKLEQKQRKRIA